MSNPSRSTDSRKSIFRIKSSPFSSDLLKKPSKKEKAQEPLTTVISKPTTTRKRPVLPNSQVMIQSPDSPKADIQRLAILDEEIALRSSSSEADVEIPRTAPRPLEDAFKINSDADVKQTPSLMNFIPRREKSSSTSLVNTTPRRRVGLHKAPSKKPTDQVQSKQDFPSETDEFLERAEEFPDSNDPTPLQPDWLQLLDAQDLSKEEVLKPNDEETADLICELNKLADDVETLPELNLPSVTLQASLIPLEEETLPTPEDILPTLNDLNKLEADLDEARSNVYEDIAISLRREKATKRRDIAKQYKPSERWSELGTVAPPGVKKLADEIKVSIAETLNPESPMPTVRALNMLFCAAGGKIIIESDLPETGAYARVLKNLPHNKRHDYLTSLLDAFKSYLTSGQYESIRSNFGNLYSAVNVTRDSSLIEAQLFSIRRAIATCLSDLDFKVQL